MADCGEAISVGGFTVGIETVSTVLSLIAAIYFYDKWKEDVDNMMDLADKYAAMGKEYCEKAEQLRENDKKVMQYARDFPDTAPEQHYREAACATVAAEAQATLLRAYSVMPSDAIGARCQIRHETSRQLIKQGVAKTADGVIRQRLLDDKYKAAKVNAYLIGINGTTPNLGSAFKTVADAFAESAAANAQAFSGAAYTAARGAGTLWQRFNSPPPMSYANSFNSPLYAQGAQPVSVGGFF